LTQRDLFNWSEAEPLAKREPAGEVPGPPPASQVTADCQLILEELRRGPTTNVALQDMVLGYRQRISDLRKKGYSIKNRKLKGRLSLYSLEE